MRKLFLIVAPALALAAFVSACGGGTTKTLKGPNGQEIKVSDSKSVPDSFPKDFPIYDGAKYQGGIETSSQGISGFYATWETGDSASKVTSFYTDKLKDGAWKVTSTVNSGDGAFTAVERKNDATQTGFVSITNADGKTTIGIIVGKNLSGTPNAAQTESASNSGSSDASPTESSNASSGAGEASPSDSSSLPNEVSLPKDFPKDRVPLPDNIRITSASSISSNGQTLNTLEFYSKDDASKISDFFTGELPKHNWTQALATTSNGESLLSYSAGQDQAENVTVTITKADVSGYQKVDMLVTVKASS
jgi:hypothetical protein